MMPHNKQTYPVHVRLVFVAPRLALASSFQAGGKKINQVRSQSGVSLALAVWQCPPSKLSPFHGVRVPLPLLLNCQQLSR